MRDIEKRSPPVVSPLTLTRPRRGTRTVTLACCVTPVRCTDLAAVGADVDRAQDRARRGRELDRHAGAVQAAARHVDGELIAAALLGDCGGAEAEAGADGQQEGNAPNHLPTVYPGGARVQ